MVTCSDEFQGELRAGFDRDVAQPLMAPLTMQQRRIFTVSNLGGRIEPGALELANDHFTVKTRTGGAKLLLVEVASHVGKILDGHEHTYGTLDRFGVRSPCCGALTMLLEKPRSSQTVRHPWFEQLSAFFGPERLAELRADEGPLRLVRTAVVHTVLQVETAIDDLFRDPPATPTHVLICAVLVINQRGPDTAVLVGCHHLRFDGRRVWVEAGASLRARPDAMDVQVENGRLRIVSRPLRDDAVSHDVELTSVVGIAQRAASLGAVERVLKAGLTRPEVVLEAERVRELAAHAVTRSIELETYARPLLRAVLQRISRTQPELGLAVLYLSANAGSRRASELSAFFARNATDEQARSAFVEFERELQELDALVARPILGFLFGV
ncbi:MAG: hypothetical protein K8S98_14345 [Planctomycetes bacterium]|nr:hypothetical protein [Planctomycetota bacterium]